MWYPCNCSDCNEEETLRFYPSKGSWIESESSMPQLIHQFQGYYPLQTECQQQFLAQTHTKNSLKKSATMGVIPASLTHKLLQIEAPPNERTLDKKVPSKTKTTSDSVDEYSPENESFEDGKQLKRDLMEAWNENGEGGSKHGANSRKNKYSDTVLKPDSSLPPVIRRRNQNRRKQLAASMADGAPSSTNAWDKQTPVNNQKLRSQSVSDEQWNQMLAIQGSMPHQGYHGSAANSEVGGVSLPRRGYNTIGSNTRTIGRGMVSSASVCDLNSLAQQQQHQQQQHQLHQQQPHGYPNMQSANSFQQLSVMSYDPNMMWIQPQPCALCQPTPMYPQSIGSGGMKRTASNLSMNLSSVGSDVTGYPYPPHAHHHMPMGYPGYYPGCHQHMVPPPYGQGSAMSIPDSMRSYNRMPSSPAPSARSSSHRSHKSSSKARSFSGVDARGRRSRNHSRKRSEESDESISSSISDEENMPIPSSKPNKPGVLAWQCDHCTFINPGHVQSCGMCSKVPGKNNERTSRRGNDRKGDKRRDRKNDSADNVHEISDYDNDQRKDTRRDTRLKSSGSVKSSSGKSRKKSHRRVSSASPSSASGSCAENDGVKLERQLRDLRLTSRSRAGEYDGLSVTSRTRDKDRDKGSLKREGGGSRYRNRRRYHSDRSMTPARSTSSRHSRRTSIDSGDMSYEETKSESDTSDRVVPQDNKSSHEGTLIGTTASESNTLKMANSKEKTASLKRWKNKSLTSIHSSQSESEDSKSSDLEDPFDNPPYESHEPRKQSLNISLTLKPQESVAGKPNSKISNYEAVVTKMKEKDNKGESQTIVEDIKDKLYEPPDNKIYVANARDTEEPSFANTLDGIETLGTNEVVDFDPSSQALEDQIYSPEQVTRDLDALMPTFNFVQRKTPEIENTNIKVDYEIYEKSVSKNEQIKEDLPETLQVSNNAVQKQDNDKNEDKLNASPSPIPFSRDPSYELIDNPEIFTATKEAEKMDTNTIKRAGKSITKENDKKNNIRDEKNKNMVTPEVADIQTIKVSDNDEDRKAKETSVEKQEFVAEIIDSSSENSNENPAPRRDRQHTPLSISSSDAQFYSPPNSPDLSLNERLRRKRVASDAQTVRPGADDDLVTALETLQMLEERRSSRDTIQSSLGQLTDEAFDDQEIFDEEEGEEEEEEAERPSSLTLTSPQVETVAENYDTLTFQDAVSQPHLAPPRQTQSSNEREVQKEKENEADKIPLGKVLPKEKKKIEIMANEEEEEIDEKFLTVEQLIKRRKQKAMKEHGLHLVQMLREAEELGYNPEEVSVAMNLSEQNKSPVEWLQENWRHMVDTVKTLASNYGLERKVNDIGEISATEAKKALRTHKGNIWAAVTECVEERQKKYNEIDGKGKFQRETIIKTLTDHEGNVDDALLDLSSTSQIGSFFSKIWGGFMEDKSKAALPILEKPKKQEINENTADQKLITSKPVTQKKAVPRSEVVSKKESLKERRKKKSSKTQDKPEGQFSDTSEYANVRCPRPSSQLSEETENEIYANFVTPLLEKLGENLPRKDEGTPIISDVLKKKIVQAILEADPEDNDDNVVFDSDEESTIEELLAVAENPTFYDYFTAVDFEDFEDYSEANNDPERVTKDAEDASNSHESPGALSGTEDEIDAEENLSEEVQSEFEYFEDFKSIESVTTDEEDEELEEVEVEEMQDIDEEEDVNEESIQEEFEEVNSEQNEHLDDTQFNTDEDVVDHPLKAYGNYDDLTVTGFSEEEHHSPQRQKNNESSSNYSKNKGSIQDDNIYAGSKKDTKNESNEPSKRSLHSNSTKVKSSSENLEQRNQPQKELKREEKSDDVYAKIDLKNKSRKTKTKIYAPKSSHRKDAQEDLEANVNEKIGTDYITEKEFDGKIEDKRTREKEEDGTNIEEKEEKGNESENRSESETEETIEEESVSVTTGRLSLSLTQTTDRKTNIGVKAQTIQTNQMPLHQSSEEDQRNSPLREKSEEPELIEADANMKRGEMRREKNEERERQDSEISMDEEREGSEISADERQDSEMSVDGERNSPETPEVDGDKVQSGGGPVTVKKATLIVRKAIANAMARESSVRRDSYDSENSSRVETPNSMSTADSEELPDGASSGSKLLSKSKSAEPTVSTPATLTTNPSAPTASTPVAQTKIEPQQKISVPPAVASYSGPIFIPSEVSSGEKDSANIYYNTRHNYYNDSPNAVKGNVKKQASADYESITDSRHDQKVTRKDVSVGKQTAKDQPITTPSKIDGPLMKEPVTPSNTDTKKDTGATGSPKSAEVKERSQEGQKEIKPLPQASKEKSPTKDIDKPKQKASAKPIKDSKKSPSLSIFSSNIKNTVNKLEKQIATDAPVKPAPSSVKSKTPVQPKLKSQTEVGQSLLVPSKKLPAGTKKLPLNEKPKGEFPEAAEEEVNATKAMQKLEGLRNRPGNETDYQEVKELKEQIQNMRKEIVAQMDTDEEGSDKDETPQLEPPSAGPAILIQEPPEEEGTVKDEKEEDEERTEGITDEDIQQYEELKFDRTVRRLLAEGQATTYEKAELAAQLLNLSFDETDSIQAAEGCSSIYTALQFLQQECELCAEKYPMGKMVSMLHCVHRCCYECANTYFSFQIKTKNIRELRCPFCNEPDLDASEEIAAEYLNNLDILLKNILEKETHELFQRKLRDWTLMKDPNFRWCNKCSSGFIANPRARKLICPDCKDVTCALCRKQWESQHTGISCKAFEKWKDENNPEAQAEGVSKHLAENGITCPNCRFTYSLAKGGCMHFTCMECKYEFCSGCSQPFKQGAKCTVGPYCERLGLHAHHPRNCLFYLRDKEPGQLQQLLKEHSIEFDTALPSGSDTAKKVCRVQEQKETVEGLRDDICGRITLEGNAGLCRLHYIEYLVERINDHGLDPVSIFDEADLRVCLRRNGKSVPVRRWESEKLYRDKLIKLIKEQLPLI